MEDLLARLHAAVSVSLLRKVPCDALPSALKNGVCFEHLLSV
jgi:hypothetical protein